MVTRPVKYSCRFRSFTRMFIVHLASVGNFMQDTCCYLWFCFDNQVFHLNKPKRTQSRDWSHWSIAYLTNSKTEAKRGRYSPSLFNRHCMLLKTMVWLRNWTSSLDGNIVRFLGAVTVIELFLMCASLSVPCTPGCNVLVPLSRSGSLRRKRVHHYANTHLSPCS